MIFDEVKVGEVFRDRNNGREITVTEITDKGFKYSCVPYSTKFGPMEYGTVSGGEIYSKDKDTNACWDFLYEKV